MELVLKDGTQIELAMGNNQNQFVVTTEIAEEIEPLLTIENLSYAHYEINGTVIETFKNKAISGSQKNLITGKVTYYLVDANSAEVERLKATMIEQEEMIRGLSETTDTLFLLILDGGEEEEDQEEDQEEEKPIDDESASTEPVDKEEQESEEEQYDINTGL